MSSSRKRFHLRQPVVVDIGCSCRKSKLSSLFFFSSSSSSSSLQKQRKSHNYTNLLSPSTTSLATNTTNTTNTTTTYTNSSFSPFNATSSPSQAFYSPKQSTTTSSTGASRQAKSSRRKKSKKEGGVVEESVAVEKESSDPYIDFRDSMLQMIVEKEIYNWDDLRELLHLFLSLNSPYHHHLILQAFTEIWNGVFLPGR